MKTVFHFYIISKELKNTHKIFFKEIIENETKTFKLALLAIINAFTA